MATIHDQPGTLVISLDFELYWGVRDQRSLESYRDNLLGVRQVVPRLLDCFTEYGIHATWATVGFLFCQSREELLASLPASKPNYRDTVLSPYNDLDRIGANEEDDPYHYAPSLIRLIGNCPHQEIATHTFSHYYCLEHGQNVDAFRADLEAALEVAKPFGVAIESLVFQRNQVHPAYLQVCRELGIKTYRGNETNWVYAVSPRKQASFVKRGLRLLDSYINLFGHQGHSVADQTVDGGVVNIPASRFLRPAKARFGLLERLRLRRILNDLTHAGENGQMYHLWWHPHNFGVRQEQNFAFLRRILDHFQSLQQRGRMVSRNMKELVPQTATVE
jgi:hypothetical protein